MGGHRFIHRVPIIQLGGMQLKAVPHNMCSNTHLCTTSEERVSLYKKKLSHTLLQWQAVVSLYTGCDFFSLRL